MINGMGPTDGYRFCPGARVSQDDWDKIFGTKEEQLQREQKQRESDLEELRDLLRVVRDYVTKQAGGAFGIVAPSDRVYVLWDSLFSGTTSIPALLRHESDMGLQAMRRESGEIGKSFVLNPGKPESAAECFSFPECMRSIEEIQTIALNSDDPEKVKGLAREALTYLDRAEKILEQKLERGR